MEYHDHAMIGATLAVAVGAQRRYGWPVVGLAALAGAAPDWDALPKFFSPSVYPIVHRVWGHNLFAVTLLGIALGSIGYLIHQSRHPPLPGEQVLARSRPGIGAWIALGVLILWTHPLFDVLYCGAGQKADWPVALFWPIFPGRLGVPMVPWHDWGATIILAAGLVLLVVLPRQRQLVACGSLLVLALYIGVRGSLLHGGWG
jgi:hypothetical protein